MIGFMSYNMKAKLAIEAVSANYYYLKNIKNNEENKKGTHSR